MGITISKQNYRGDIFYRVKSDGVYLTDFRTKKEAVKYANTKRSKKIIAYHGRKGHPIVHIAQNGRKYIMVRKSGGGTKRLYSGSRYKTDGETKILIL